MAERVYRKKSGLTMAPATVPTLSAVQSNVGGLSLGAAQSTVPVAAESAPTGQRVYRKKQDLTALSSEPKRVYSIKPEVKAYQKLSVWGDEVETLSSDINAWFEDVSKANTSDRTGVPNTSDRTGVRGMIEELKAATDPTPLINNYQKAGEMLNRISTVASALETQRTAYANDAAVTEYVNGVEEYLKNIRNVVETFQTDLAGAMGEELVAAIEQQAKEKADAALNGGAQQNKLEQNQLNVHASAVRLDQAMTRYRMAHKDEYNHNANLAPLDAAARKLVQGTAETLLDELKRQAKSVGDIWVGAMKAVEGVTGIPLGYPDANWTALRNDVATGLQESGYQMWDFAEQLTHVFGVKAADPFFDKLDADREEMHAYNEELDQMADPTIAAIGDVVLQPVSAALPNLAAAILSGGATAPAQLGVLGGSTLYGGGSVIGEMVSKPSFWLSFAQSSGSAYKNAKDKGASELEAQAVAWLTAFPSAMVEVGGGLEAIPTTQGVWNVVKKVIASEGGEEVLQGLIENAASMAVFEQEKQWGSFTDTDALFSLPRMAQEFIGGLTVGAVLGGGTKATQYAYRSYQYTELGSQFVNGKNGATIDKAIEIGLSNAKGTDAYNAAVKIQQKVQAGEHVSPYMVGRMVAESQTEQAQISRDIERTVLSTAKEMNIPTDAAETVSAAAVSLGQKVEFVSPDQMHNRYMAGEYDSKTDTVRLNAAERDIDKLIGAVLAHEMVHTAEGTDQLQKLAQIAERMENRKNGAGAWEKLQADVKREYAAAGKQLSDPEVPKEALAHWIAENLFQNKAFAKAVVDGDANAGNAFFYMIDRVRRAMGAKKASAGNLAMLERLLMQAIDARTIGPKEGDVQGAVNGAPVIDLSDHSELAKRVGDLTGTPKYKVIQQYIFENLGGNSVVLSDGKKAVVEQNDAKHIGKKANNKKIAIISEIKRVVESAELVAEENSTKDKKFDHFWYYEAVLKYGKETFPIYVNVGRSRYQGTYHLYDLTQKLRDTAHRINGVGRPVGDTLKSDISNPSVTDVTPVVKTQSMQEGAGISARGSQNGVQGALLSPESMEAVDNGTWREARASQNAEGVTPSADDYTSSVTADAATPSPQGEGFEAVQVDEAAVLETAVRSQLQGRKQVDVSALRKANRNGEMHYDTDAVIDQLGAELGEAELLKRMYNAAQMNRPTGMVEIDGQRVDAGAYMDAYEQALPDDVAALEQTVRRLELERAAEIVRLHQEGALQEHTFGRLKIDLQLFAAKRKWDLLQLDAGENGTEVRQFYEKRLRGTDANHSDELVEMLAGRSETYNPIANEKTLSRAKDKLRDAKYQEKLLKRIGRYNPRDLFNAQEVAAATVLINDAINEGEFGVAADLITGLSRKGTEAGRAVQAFSMMARMTPEGTLKAAVRTLQADADYVAGEGANEGLNVLADDLVKAIAEAEEEGLSPDEIADRIRNGASVRGVEGAAPYGENSSTDIHNMLAKIRRGDFEQNDKVEFGRVPDAIVQRLRELTGTDVTGYKMAIEARILDHLLRDHGAHGAANQTLADDADIARMGDVLANPDDIRKGDPTKTYTHQKNGKMKPSPTVIYEKGEGNLSYYVIHTIADSKKKTLYVTTAFIGQPGYKKGAQQSSDGKASGDTANPELAGTPTDIISRGEGQVKAEVKMSREELVQMLSEDLAAEKGNYLTEEQIYDALWKVVEQSTNIPEQLKRYVLKKIRKDDGGLAQRIYEVYRKGNLSSVKMRRAMEEALELPTLTDEDLKWIVEKATEIQALDNDPVKQADAMDELYDYLGAKLSVKGLDRLQAWRKFGMLFNVKTHLRNILSNFAYSRIRKADDAVAMVLERIFVRDRSQWGAALGWSHTEHGKNLLPDLQKQAELAVLEMQKRGAKYEQGTGQLKQRRKYFGEGKVGEGLNKANRWNSNLLEAEDVWFFRPAYIDALGQIMTARRVTEITPELHELAMQRALEATFRADNAISEVISSLKRFQNASTTGKRLFGHGVDVVIPFHKTPANIATQTVLHSPVGIAKGAVDLYNAVHGKGSKDAATAINTMAKGVTGTALLMIGLLLGKAGLFNVGFGKTEKERAADEMAGLQEGSFVIGGVSISLDWLQPVASPLIVGASIAERMTEEGLDIKGMFGAVMDGTDSLFEMTMLQSLYDILGGYDAGVSATAMSVVENVVSQSVPTLVGQLARAIDPVQRKTKGDSGFETVVNQVMAKIPGLTYLLDPELDVWGNEVYRTGKPGTGTTVLNALQQILIPANTKVGTGKDDPISEEILRLYEGQGGAVIPTAVTRDEAKDAGEDYVDINKLLGGVNRLAVEEFINNRKAYDVMVETGELTEKGNPRTKKTTKYYRDMTDEERRKVLGRIYSGSKDGLIGDASEKTEEQLTDNERYIRDLLRRVREGKRGTYDTAKEQVQQQPEQPKQEDTSYYEDLLRRMKNGY